MNTSVRLSMFTVDRYRLNCSVLVGYVNYYCIQTFQLRINIDYYYVVRIYEFFNNILKVEINQLLYSIVLQS